MGLRVIFKIIYVCPAIIFLLWFVVNVSSMASKHMDYQVTYPIFMLAFGFILLLLHFCLRFVCRKMKGRWYIIPTIYILTGITALLIGSITPCC